MFMEPLLAVHLMLDFSTTESDSQIVVCMELGNMFASANCRYGFIVYNGSVHYWQISRVLQREGLRCHLLPSEQSVVDAVRRLPDKKEWLSSLLLQLALGQLEVISMADSKHHYCPVLSFC